MKLQLGIIIALLLLIAPLTIAATQPTQKYSKVLLDPLYRQSMDKNNDYTWELTVEAPDGFSDIQSAIITMQLWLSPTVNFDILVDGQACNTPTYQVHTTYANAGEGTIFFDCSNIITGPGTYSVQVTPDKNTGASTTWADITYVNSPQGDMNVHGTEYIPGENAKVWLQLIDSNGDYVNSGACQVDIYTPTNDGYIENAYMTNANHDGIYYYNLRAPQQQGVWPVIAKCFYNVSETIETADGFTLTTGKVDDKDYTVTYTTNGKEHKIKQVSGALDFYYSFTNMCGTDVDEELLSGLSINTNVKWTDSVTNDNIILSVYNFTSSSWIDLPNMIYDPNDRDDVTNSVSSNNLTRDGVVSTSGETRVRYRDTLTNQGGDKKIEVDMINVVCEQYAGTTWQEVKGSSEMHISSENLWTTQVESGQIFNDTWPGRFEYNVTLSSQTSQTEEDQPIFVELPVPFPCHYVESLSIDGVETNFTGKDSLNPDTAGCSVNWIQDLDTDTNYQIQVVSENHFKRVESTWITESSYDYETISLACKNYQITNGFPNFTIPQIEEPGILYNDEFMAVCSDYLDTYYRFNYTYWNQFRTEEGIFTEADMLALDEEWRYLTLLVDRLQTESTNILGGLTTGGMYSTAIIANPTGQPVPVWATYWANASTTFINYQLLAAMYGGIINVSVDTSELANAVWQYSGTPATSLLDFISGNVWGTTVRTLTAFNLWDHETAAEYVWNNSVRNLTIAPFDPDAIAAAVWNSPNRNLTSFDFVVDANIDWETGALYIWNATSRGLTDAVEANVDWATGALYTWNATTRELTAIQWDHENAAAYVWNSTARELTSSPFDPSAIANATWNYADRQLTSFDFVVNTTVDYATIGEYVWNNTQRDLTFYDHQNAALYNWNATTRELTAAPFDPNLIANATWNFADRQLSDFGFTVDALVDWETGAEYVWNFSNRDLTFYDHATAALYNWNATSRELTTSPFDPTAIANATWNYADRQLTAINFEVDAGVDFETIGEYVWNTTTRGLTENTTPNVDWATGAVFLWNATTRELTASPFNPAAIWNYSNRSLTESNLNTTELTDEIWNYSARYTHGVQLN